MEKMFKKKPIEINLSDGLGALATLTPIFEIIELDNFSKYYSCFNNYAREITISPKGSEALQLPKCACGATSIMDIDSQKEFMLDILSSAFHKLKISGIVVFEYYKCKQYIHCHGIMNFIPDKKIRALTKLINAHYNNYNRVLTNIKPIRCMASYEAYLKKDQQDDDEIFMTKDIYDVSPSPAFLEKEKTLNPWTRSKCTCDLCTYCKTFD